MEAARFRSVSFTFVKHVIPLHCSRPEAQAVIYGLIHVVLALMVYIMDIMSEFKAVIKQLLSRFEALLQCLNETGEAVWFWRAFRGGGAKAYLADSLSWPERKVNVNSCHCQAGEHSLNFMCPVATSSTLCQGL
jgi:hypothetical protein